MCGYFAQRSGTICGSGVSRWGVASIFVVVGYQGGV